MEKTWQECVEAGRELMRNPERITLHQHVWRPWMSLDSLPPYLTDRCSCGAFRSYMEGHEDKAVITSDAAGTSSQAGAA